MSSRTSNPPSPSPPPPPIPSTPGPRATALQKLYNDAITHVLKTCSYPNFAACFPTPAKAVPADLRDVHGQFVAKLDHWLRREFDNVLAARDVVPSLNELDRLIDDAQRRKASSHPTIPTTGDGGADQEKDQEKDEAGRASSVHAGVAPHTLPPTQLYLSHLAPTLGMYDAQMKERQERLTRENQALFEQVLKQRQEIEGLVGGLEKVVKDLSGSVEALKPEEMEKLREEARSVDEMMR